MKSEECTSIIKSWMSNDTLYRNYGIKLVELGEEYAETEMVVREDMNNFLGITHGAMIFALADQAFAASSNSKGQASVALNMSIAFLEAPKIGEKLVAKARMLSSTRRTGLYDIKVYGENGRLIAVCQGLVYRKKESVQELSSLQ
ncbi:MAG: hotdog fold thioesterase [Candidatus Bathyarchaeia archaeon]